MWTQADRDLYKDDGRRYPSDLTDAQWALIAPVLSSYDPLKVDLREMVNACLYPEKTGCPWRHLPSDFGPWVALQHGAPVEATSPGASIHLGDRG